MAAMIPATDVNRRRPNRNQARLASAAGLSLVEATIILGVLSILTAVLSPAVRNFSDVARIARATEDCRTIAAEIQQFIDDNGELQFLIAANGTGATPPTRPDNTRVDLLVGDGDIPALGPAVVSEVYWIETVNGLVVDTISNHLIENNPGEIVANRWRNPSDITRATAGGQNIDFARPESSGFNAPFAWRGAYLTSPVDPDPWGDRYAVNVVFLDPKPTTTIFGITSGFFASDYPRLDVFCLSAGADHEIDTKSAQDGAVPGDDDIIALVSSNAR